MDLIAITDIFGKTIAFEKLIKQLSGSYSAIEIVDPYDGRNLYFNDQEEAYRYFIENVGLENYIELLYSKLQGKKKSNQVLLGFSVGASAVWAVSSKLESFINTRGICFYSSQVRNYLEVDPKIEIDIYFSEHEPTYDVDEIHKLLACKPKVTCHRTLYLHGFMNQKSNNFNIEAYSKYLKILKLE